MLVGRGGASVRRGITVGVSAAERWQLEALVSDRNSPQKHVWRARIVLLTADGVGTNEIMRRTGTSKVTVWRWQERFMRAGIAGLLRDKTRPSRIPPLPTSVHERTVALTLGDPPGETTHWTAAMMAKAVGVSVSSVQRIWRAHGLQPHRMRQFKLSHDPDFVPKLKDIVGLYVDPPAHAIVLSVDEKSQIQALDRTQPGLPLKPGRCGTMTHDYKRNGTIDLFAAMNIATGEVLTDLRKGHTGADVLGFFKQIDASVPRGLGVHVVLDNLSAHSTPEIAKWLTHKDRRRWHLHYTPTSSSWVNLVERWFKELTDKRLRRGTFTSVADLSSAITTWAEHWNTDPKPFIWKAPAADIIAKVQRGRATLHQINTQTDH